MTRRLLVLIAPLLLGAALLARIADVTFVMKNGERISGTFSYNHTDQYQLIINGRERSFPSDDIAMIAFTPGDPSGREIGMLPQSDNPPELERHSLVLRNGDMVRGKIYDFRDNTLIMDLAPGDRRTYNFNDIARLYISAPGARNVFRSPGNTGTVGNVNDPQGRRGGGRGLGPGQMRIQVPGNQAWTDTGLNVNRGDQVRFSATGEVQISQGNMAGPDGKTGAFTKEIYPVTGVAAGALIGRVGNSRPFAIGSKTDPIVMPATGTLFLGINDNNFPDNGGGFEVRLVRSGG